MESRTAASIGSYVSKRFVAIALIAAAAVLGMTGAYVLRAVVPGSAAPAATTQAQFVNGPAQGDSLRHHGTQSLGGVEISPAAPRDPSDWRGGPKV
jgi:hypothetical protein